MSDQEERPYTDGFGTWQVMIPASLPEGERSKQAAAMIEAELRQRESPGWNPPEGGVPVRSLGRWTDFEHFAESWPT